MTREKVLIVGGGFAGVKTALELADDDRFVVTLLSDQPYLRYYPTLYHTATGGTGANSNIPLARLFQNKHVKVVPGRATTLDKRAKVLTTEDGKTYEYDTLVLALGVVTNYFGIQGLREFSYGIKSINEANRLKAHLHQQLIDDKKPDLNYVIIGAGPTGIELAGALPGYLKEIMLKHGVEPRKVHIDLIEAAPRLLPRLPRDTSRMVARQLKRLGIRLYLKQAVQGVTADELTVNGKPIRSHTVIWTAGVTNHPFFKDNAFALTLRGKVSVDAYLQAEDNIFVIGDNANTPYSGLAQTAVIDGAFLAKNLKRRKSGRDMRSYIVKKPITVIPAGPKWAAVIWGSVRMYGRLGWILRELGDLRGFLDYETIPGAIEQWTTEFAEEDGCTVCHKAPAL
ncbi:MAG TPA: FAD-dependent oxidoreductase [Candidatus Microsaccharimonas sp.]|nr:FAD-dependent oxidoreductase [Candidatus Microsaccharimonas sp.]